MNALAKLTRLATVAALGASVLGAQSLDPKHPAPLESGVNAANIDAFMTPHYWTFVAKKGNVKINVTFRAQSILGAQLRTQIAFNIYNAATPDKKFTKVLESMGREVSEVIEGPSEADHQMVIEVVPPKSIVRAGGDYQIQAVQGVSFGVDFVGAKHSDAGADPIVTRHFRVSGCTNPAQCTVRFLPGGAVALPGKEEGTWRLFDRERSVYVVTIGNERRSLKLKPGVGLEQVGVEQNVVYQEVR
jgi:hypothetical protein